MDKFLALVKKGGPALDRRLTHLEIEYGGDAEEEVLRRVREQGGTDLGILDKKWKREV